MIFLLLNLFGKLMINEPATVGHQVADVLIKPRIVTEIRKNLNSENGSWIRIQPNQYPENYFYNGNNYYFITWIEGGVDHVFPLENVAGDLLVGNNYENFAKTGKQVFYRNLLISGADPKTFTPIDTYFSKDNSNVFAGEKMIENADVDSFETIITDEWKNNFISKDKKNVYFENKIIAGADPASYISMNESGYGKDKNHVFYQGKVLAAADPETFGPFETNYNHGKDKSHIFFEDILIEGADISTFEPVNTNECGMVCDYQRSKDANNEYYKGVSVNIDPARVSGKVSESETQIPVKGGTNYINRNNQIYFHQ